MAIKKSKPTSDIFQINHYLVKSEEEFLNKKKKGRTNLKGFEEEYYASNASLNVVEDATLMKDYVHKIKKRLNNVG